MPERGNSITDTNDVHTEETGHETHREEEDGYNGEYENCFAVIILECLDELDVLNGDKLGSVEELIAILGLLLDPDQNLIDGFAFEVVSQFASDAWSVECFWIE